MILLEAGVVAVTAVSTAVRVTCAQVCASGSVPCNMCHVKSALSQHRKPQAGEAFSCRALLHLVDLAPFAGLSRLHTEVA